jgi:hypothetical protein
MEEVILPESSAAIPPHNPESKYTPNAATGIGPIYHGPPGFVAPGSRLESD